MYILITALSFSFDIGDDGSEKGVAEGIIGTADELAIFVVGDDSGRGDGGSDDGGRGGDGGDEMIGDEIKGVGGITSLLGISEVVLS